MSIGVGLGFTSFPFAQPREFFQWAELCEQHSVDSIWQSDRLISRDAFLESMTTMAALTGITERIRFGMNVVVAPLRDPLVLAKQCATIDFLSGGRLLPAFGVGFDKAAEWRATGRDEQVRKQRGARSNEMLELIARLWSEENVSFSGKYFNYEEATIAPRPAQKRLPLWIGGHSKPAIRRTAQLGTGWIGGLAAPEIIAQAIQAIKQELIVTGRSIDHDHYGATIAFRIGNWDDDAVQNYPLLRRPGVRTKEQLMPLLCVGDNNHLIERINRYINAGASKFVLFPIAQGRDDVFDQTRRVIAEVIPAVES